MTVTKQQILTGAANYVRAEMVPHIPDKGFRVVLEALASMVELSPQAVDKYISHPMVSALLQEKDGVYDLDLVESALTRAMESQGGLLVTIPAIPLVSPHEKTMNFTANDIRTMKRYITG